MYLGALNFVGIFTTLRERTMYNAFMGVIWGLGTILGPVVGGVFTDTAQNWRWSFYINLVLAGIFGPILIFLMPTHQPQPDKSFFSKLIRMDWLGTILIGAVYTTFVVAMTFGGAIWPYSDGRFIATITVCGVLLVVFVVTQYFSVLTKNPIFPGQFIRSRSLLLLYFGTASAGAGMAVTIYFLPLYFQFVHSDNALKAAVRLLPFVIVLIVSVMLNGALAPAVGYYNVWYLAGGVLLTAGGACMFKIGVDTATSKIYGYSVLIAAGAGLSAQLGYAVAQAKVPPQKISYAISFMNVAQIGSIVLALAIAGAVYQNVGIQKLSSALAGQGFSIDDIKNAVSGTQSAIFQQGSPEVKAAALQALIQAMNKVFALIIAAGALSIVSSLGMKREKVFLPTVEM